MHGIIETMSNLIFIETAHRELVFSTKHLNISKTIGQALSAVELRAIQSKLHNSKCTFLRNLVMFCPLLFPSSVINL